MHASSSTVHTNPSAHVHASAEVVENNRKAFYKKLTFWDKVYIGIAGGMTGFYIYHKVDWDGSKAVAAEVGMAGVLPCALTCESSTAAAAVT